MKETAQEIQLSLFVHDVDECDSRNVKVGSAADLRVETLAESVSEASAPHVGPVPECEWSEFVRIHGRVPRLGDARQPWHYRGWLLYYRFLCECHPEVAPRWDFWARTRTAGRVLNEPIPVLQFKDCGSSDCSKGLGNWLHCVNRLHSHWSPMDTLLDWFLWGFGLSSEPPRITERLNEELYREVNLGPLLLNPYDYLGEWIASQKGKWNPHAFFPTPHNVVELMVQLTLQQTGSQSEDMRFKTVMEPALGSGRMLLHASNYSLRLYGADIDPLMVKTAMVNGALYAPWMVRPFPDGYFAESVLAGDTANIVTEDSTDRGICRSISGYYRTHMRTGSFFRA